MKTYVGQGVNRLDGLEKVTGTARFTHDVVLPGMLHAKVLRSPHAHARIISIDTGAAEALPGVKAIATWENTPHRLFNASAFSVLATPDFVPVLDQYIFDDRVRFVGDEVAAVAASSEKIAAEAVKLIRVEYEVLPAVFDPMEAMEEKAPELHKTQAGKNITGEISQAEIGDFEKAWENCDITYEGTVKVPIQKHIPMETHGAVADYKVNGELNVWSTTQAPYPTKLILAHIFDLPQSKVHVKNPPYIGGGFGGRSGLSGKAEAIAAALSKLARKPVKLVYDRTEDLIATDTRHGGYISVKLGAKKDGTFQALELNTVMNTGAYCSWGATIPLKIYTFGSTVYKVPNIHHYGKCVYTNILPAGAMRGFGNPQAMFAVETAVDAIAKMLGRDPVELRLQNIIKVGDSWGLPFPCVSTGLAECIRRAADGIGWKDKRGKKQGGNIRRGVGLGVGRHVSASAPSSSVYLRLEMDGSLHLATSMPDMGTGTTTTLPQILSDALGIPLEQVHMTFADTRSAPFDIGGHSTRSLYESGLAILAAAEELKKDIIGYAAAVLGVEPDSLCLEKGSITGGSKAWPLSELAYYAHQRKKRFESIGRPGFTTTVPWEAHSAEVEVDMETGIVKVLKVIAAHDVGTAINPTIVEGQIEGGVLMSLGYALREEMTFNEKGEPYNDSIHKYMLFTAEDVPEIEAVIIEASDPLGPFGAKGVGECSVVPTACAVAAAVEDAIGIRLMEIPMTPMRVLKAINGLK